MQTNSYIVPKEKRTEHARLLHRFRQTLGRLGCDHFEAYEQTGANWGGGGESSGRFVQIMRFRDRKHQLQVQEAERKDAAAQTLIREFCELINFPYQQQQGLFAVGFYNSVLPVLTPRPTRAPEGGLPAVIMDEAPEPVEPAVETVESIESETPPEPIAEMPMVLGPDDLVEDVEPDLNNLFDIEPPAAESDNGNGQGEESRVRPSRPASPADTGVDMSLPPDESVL